MAPRFLSRNLVFVSARTCTRRSDIAPCRSNEINSGSERLVQRQKGQRHSVAIDARSRQSTVVTVAKPSRGCAARTNWWAGYGARAGMLDSELC